MNEEKIADALTQNALTAYSRIDDPRLRELVTALTRRLHAFVKETRLTDPEFEAAWTLLAEMAKLTGEERNEFLLFCDVAGVSQLIEAINHPRSPPAVGYALVGPFFRANAPSKESPMSAAPRKAILGAWRLVHSVERRPGGEKHYPFNIGRSCGSGPEAP
jgi:Catechol dioxygenase N terminus